MNTKVGLVMGLITLATACGSATPAQPVHDASAPETSVENSEKTGTGTNPETNAQPGGQGPSTGTDTPGPVTPQLGSEPSGAAPSGPSGGGPVAPTGSPGH
jgi:hypothetical protein